MIASIFFSLLLLVACNVDVSAQEQSLSLPRDSSAVEARVPPSPLIAQYRNDPDFAYSRRGSQLDSWWMQFVQWLRDLFSNTRAGEGWGFLVKILMYGGIAGLLVFAVLQLFNMNARNFLRGRSAAVEVPFLDVADEEAGIDLKQRAESARASGAYRDAVRYYYLHTLRLLDANRIIEWQKRKTNHDYLVECRNSGIEPVFSRMTYLFDYAWYGNFPVRESLVDEAGRLSASVEASLESTS